ncbi:recombination mediator RecR [Candidatus Finniella inopinata]|uniref:Recombination protein RecR n=1 Tax=Candidatus Finniella inopinata TaxID=1696036 RepID=A0A4Q7DIE0_9PROT|nr:recombination mediator RecR [Candidatus Finniella inopinata]RZI46563.1 recombination protein RecR [Candidatus Finniella inopinata]
MNSPEIQQMIQLLSRLPGLGPRSGRRVALHLLKKREALLKPLIEALQTADQTITTCQQCFNLDTSNPCHLCQDTKRDDHSLCIVADVADLWAIERSQIFKGRYHVLGGLLSALDNIGPQQLTIQPLLKRLENGQIQEIILALNSTVDGQTTVHYLANHLQSYAVKLSSLAQGVPMGGELDYLDDGTLSAAFSERKRLYA